MLEDQTRLRKRAITGGGGLGFDGKNAAAKKSARFIGDVTRLRQTACHPQIVRKSDSMLGGKRRILVTHQLQYLRDAAVDRVAVLAAGRLTACGSYDEVRASGALCPRTSSPPLS